MITGSLIFMKEISLSSLQQMQLSLILTSLYDNNHISTLLGFSDSADHVTSSQPCDGSVDLMLAEILMKTILRNLANETVSKLNNVNLALKSEGIWDVLACTIPFHSFINNQGVSQSFNNTCIMEIQVDMQRNYYLIIII